MCRLSEMQRLPLSGTPGTTAPVWGEGPPSWKCDGQADGSATATEAAADRATTASPAHTNHRILMARPFKVMPRVSVGWNAACTLLRARPLWAAAWPRGPSLPGFRTVAPMSVPDLRVLLLTLD